MTTKKSTIEIGNPLQMITFQGENRGPILHGAGPWRKGNHLYVTIVPRKMDRRKAKRVYNKCIIATFIAKDLAQVDHMLEENPREYTKNLNFFAN